MDQNTHKIEKLEIPVMSKLFVIYEITHRLIFKLPKFERYTLGEKTENVILEGVEMIVMANGSNKYEKEKYLLKLNAKIEMLKLLYRIMLNCQIIEFVKYLEIETHLQEAGKMTQGWVKYTRTTKPTN